MKAFDFAGRTKLPRGRMRLAERGLDSSTIDISTMPIFFHSVLF